MDFISYQTEKISKDINSTHQKIRDEYKSMDGKCYIHFIEDELGDIEKCVLFKFEYDESEFTEDELVSYTSNSKRLKVYTFNFESGANSGYYFYTYSKIKEFTEIPESVFSDIQKLADTVINAETELYDKIFKLSLKYN